MLTWVGIEVFKKDPTHAVSEGSARAEHQSRPRVPAQTAIAPVISEERPESAPSIAESSSSGDVAEEPKPATQSPSSSEVQEQPDAPPSPVNEVLPDPPQSALDTIRGTVRVSIRVIIGKDGTVLAADSDDPGPSRYFERLSLEAAKKWTFTPAAKQAQRVMLIKFHFTNDGATATAQPLN
jgi:TonB family protein